MDPQITNIFPPQLRSSSFVTWFRFLYFQLSAVIFQVQMSIKLRGIFFLIMLSHSMQAQIRRKFQRRNPFEIHRPQSKPLGKLRGAIIREIPFFCSPPMVLQHPRIPLSLPWPQATTTTSTSESLRRWSNRLRSWINSPAQAAPAASPP